MKINTLFSSIHSLMRMNTKAFRYVDMGMTFLCFFIIGIGIVIGLYAFHSDQVDIRELEAQILAEKLILGLLHNGKLDETVFLDSFDIYTAAGINKDVIDRNEHFFSIDIKKDKEIRKNFVGGNREYEVLCQLRGEKMPRCFSQSYSFDKYTVTILTASNYGGGSR